jgi:uncharacterized membrane protein YjjP (DUF1212 family)
MKRDAHKYVFPLEKWNAGEQRNSIFHKFFFDQELCLSVQLFGGIVWLLPGITITMAVLELFSKMIVYGSSRLTFMESF